MPRQITIMKIIDLNKDEVVHTLDFDDSEEHQGVLQSYIRAYKGSRYSGPTKATITVYQEVSSEEILSDHG